MPSTPSLYPWTCRACSLAVARRRIRLSAFIRAREARVLFGSTQSPNRPEQATAASPASQNEDGNSTPGPDSGAGSNLSAPDAPAGKKGAMARRLEEATEEVLLTGGRAGRRAVDEAGFSDELKERLLDKLAAAAFESEHAAALAEAGIPSRINAAAGQGTRDIAAAQPWTGEETTEDAVLRMLNDARKPLAPGLRGKPKIPAPSRPPPVDMRIRREPVVTAGRKVATARERAEAYAGMGMKEKGLNEDERAAFKKEFRERFTPGARAMPVSVTGLAALANERIEDAISRGQFKNIPRGKGIERDARADNPFIDTTEYIMNKMIKRQDIVPPWIDKQQELVRAANIFRSRLRNDWKRHAARLIASRGGSLDEQMRQATEYARAEEIHNPRRRNVDQIAVPTSSTDDVVMVKMRQQAWESDVSEATPTPSSPPPPSMAPPSTITEMGPADPQPSDPQITVAAPFRDPAWEAAERTYMELAIRNLNALTRSYNLVAPELAKKAYFSLEREMAGCFADVAPLLADTIKQRAARPPADPLGGGGQGQRLGGVLERFRAGDGARVYESRAPHYGLKELWKDLWTKAD